MRVQRTNRDRRRLGLRRSLWVGVALAAVPVLFVTALVVGVLAIMGSPPMSGGAVQPGTVPAAYVGLIETYGRSCRTLTPARLAAQLYQESRFQPGAVSPVGAVGIAQFMPETWRAHGVDANGDGAADPADPADAIPAAAAYDCALAKTVSAVPGDVVSNMLAAYNAGPYAVLQHGGIPPYVETQNYVARIRQLEPAFATSVAPPPAASSAASVAIRFGFEMLGTPYRWGGEGTAEDGGRFDCSGLMQAAYRAGGVTLPRTSRQQWYAGPHVRRSGLQPGDLVFFAYDTRDPRTIHHVGLYVGHGYMIDAPYTGAVIRFDPIDQPGYIGAVRPA
jgi:cell wall-associated NlpC family hydrolase